MPRYKLTIEYDGSGFSGWQRQENGPSIQQVLEEAFFALTGQTISVHGAGRTDAGVHASGQVAHVDLGREWSAWRLREAINAHLVRRPIAVLEVEPAADGFDARRSAIRRDYLYRIVNRRAPLTFELGRAWLVKYALDAGAMHEAAQLLIGRHDFSTFRDFAVPGEFAAAHARAARSDARRRPDRIFCRRPIVPASAGALDGRLAGRGRLRQVAGGRFARRAGGGRPQPLRAGGAGLRALSRASGV